MNLSRRLLWTASLLSFLAPAAVAQAASVSFVTPTAGECVRAGMPFTVTWTAAQSNESLYYTSTGNPPIPATDTPIASGLSGKSYTWNVPANTAATSTAHLWYYTDPLTPLVDSGAFAITTAPPSAPVLGVSSKGQTSVSLTWTQSKSTDCVNGYTLYRGESGASAKAIRTFSASTGNFVDSGLTPGTQYTYQVAAFDSDTANAVNSIAVAVTTDAAPTPTPTPTPVPTAAPDATSTPSPSASASPVPSETPTADAEDVDGANSLLASPSPTPSGAASTSKAAAETPAARIVRYLATVGLLLIVIGTGVLLVGRRKELRSLTEKSPNSTPDPNPDSEEL